VDPIALLILLGLGGWVIVEMLKGSTSGGGWTESNFPSSLPPQTPSSSTGAFSPADIATVAANAGFSGSDLVTAVAIALAESSGNPSAVGDLNVTPGGSIGLWQINLHYHPQYSAAQLVDPQTNADAAFQIYQAAGDSFTPWSTFKNGAYMSFLNQASTFLTA
jgi:hypothetical protein